MSVFPSNKLFLEATDFLQAVTTGGQENNETARVLTADLNEAQLNWKPAVDQWSMAQCLEHLAVSTKAFEKYFAAALQRGRSRPQVAESLRYKPSLMGGLLVRYVSPEGARKLRAPKIIRPADSSRIEGSLEMFLREQDWFIDFVGRAHGVDYNKTRLRSPITPLVRYSLADAFVIIVLHAQRHLQQARRVRELPEFPRT